MTMVSTHLRVKLTIGLGNEGSLWAPLSEWHFVEGKILD